MRHIDMVPEMGLHLRYANVIEPRRLIGGGVVPEHQLRILRHMIHRRPYERDPVTMTPRHHSRQQLHEGRRSRKRPGWSGGPRYQLCHVRSVQPPLVLAEFVQQDDPQYCQLLLLTFGLLPSAADVKEPRQRPRKSARAEWITFFLVKVPGTCAPAHQGLPPSPSTRRYVSAWFVLDQ